MRPGRKLPRGQLYFDAFSALSGLTRHIAAPPAPGSVVRAFEEAWASAHGASHAIALPHARTALHHLLTALALPKGSEVITTPVTIPEVISVIAMQGLVPRFVDLALHSAAMDLYALEEAITPRTSAILVTHLAGLPCDMERVARLAQRRGLVLLEDVSQAPLTRFRGRMLGLFGKAGFASLTPLKPASTYYGGITITNDGALAERLRRIDAGGGAPFSNAELAALWWRDALLDTVTDPAVFSAFTYPLVRAGERLDPERIREFQRGNLLNRPEKRRRVERLEALPERYFRRFGDAQAAVGLRGLTRLESDHARRRELALRLHDRLVHHGVSGTPTLTPDHRNEGTFWRYPLWLPSTAARTHLRRELLARGIDTSPTNLECLSREPAFAPFNAETPEAARFLDTMLFLPVHPTLRESDMDRIADAVAELRERA